MNIFSTGLIQLFLRESCENIQLFLRESCENIPLFLRVRLREYSSVCAEGLFIVLLRDFVHEEFPLFKL